jgi:hypothetical protein
MAMCNGKNQTVISDSERAATAFDHNDDDRRCAANEILLNWLGSLHDSHVERCPSGLRSTLGKRV